jgi:hypothetical protein
MNIAYVARWQHVEGVAVNEIKRRFAMLCAEHEFEDLLQEAYLVYMKCKARYDPNFGDADWKPQAGFAHYFRVSLRNKLLKMGAKCGRAFSIEIIDAQELAVEDDAFFRQVLKELPHPVRWLINQVCFGPEAKGREALRKLATEALTPRQREVLQEYLPALS